jgi:hypothetical protein
MLHKVAKSLLGASLLLLLVSASPARAAASRVAVTASAEPGSLVRFIRVFFGLLPPAHFQAKNGCGIDPDGQCSSSVIPPPQPLDCIDTVGSTACSR